MLWLRSSGQSGAGAFEELRRVCDNCVDIHRAAQSAFGLQIFTAKHLLGVVAVAEFPWSVRVAAGHAQFLGSAEQHCSVGAVVELGKQ